MYIKYSKCEFLPDKVHFLGHVISPEGIVVDLAKIEAVANWKAYKSTIKVKNFLRLAGCYRRFVERFSKIRTPLTALNRKRKKNY